MYVSGSLAQASSVLIKVFTGSSSLKILCVYFRSTEAFHIRMDLRSSATGIQTSERSSAEKGFRNWLLGTLRRLAGGSRAAGPARATFRLFRRSVAGPSAVRLDPLSDAAELLHQTLKDLALTKEQQEVFERVVSCNSRFWQVAVDGCLDGSPPWRRHVALNLALLRAYHRHLAAQRIVDALELDVSEVQTSNHNSLNYSEAVEALRYCRWALAAYGGRGKRDGTEKINADGTSKMAAPVSEPLQLGMGEEERVAMAAAVAECSPTAIIISDLDDASQASDPLCPRFLLAEDVQHQELIVSVRGTQSLSDLLADLVGDAEDFAGDYAQLEIERHS